MLRRVAAHFRILSIDELVDAVSPEELDIWMGLALHDGWGEEWSMASTLAASFHNSLQMVLSYFGKELKEKDFREADHFEPPIRTNRKPVERQPLSLEQIDAQHRAMAGLR